MSLKRGQQNDCPCGWCDLSRGGPDCIDTEGWRKWQQRDRELMAEHRERFDLARLIERAPDVGTWAECDNAGALDRAKSAVADIAVIFPGPDLCVTCCAYLDSPDDLCRHRSPVCGRCCTSNRHPQDD